MEHRKVYKIIPGADMEFVIGRQMKIYIVCALIWVMVTVIFTIIILLVQSQLSYYIAIVAQLFTILSGGLIYLMLRMETKGPILEKFPIHPKIILEQKHCFR